MASWERATKNDDRDDGHDDVDDDSPRRSSPQSLRRSFRHSPVRFPPHPCGVVLDAGALQGASLDMGAWQDVYRLASIQGEEDAFPPGGIQLARQLEVRLQSEGSGGRREEWSAGRQLEED